MLSFLIKNKINRAIVFPVQRANVKQESPNWTPFVLFTNPIKEQNTDIVKQIAAIT